LKSPGTTPGHVRRRSSGRRDLILIALVTVAVFCIGVAFGLFRHLDTWFEARFPSAQSGPLGILVVLFLSSLTFAALRAREARQEESLRAETDLRFRTVVEQVPAVTYTWDPTAPVGEAPPLYVSPQLETMLGYTPEQWSEDPEFWISCIHPEDRDRVLEASDCADREGDTFLEEYRMIAADGRVVWVRDEATVVEWDEARRPLRSQGVMYDITERKEAELKLQEAEGRYRTLVERVPVVIYVDAVDDLSTATYISPRYEALTGYSAEQRMAEPELWVSILHPDDRDRVLAESARTNETGDPFDIEYRLVRADGGVVWVHDHAYLATGPDGVAAWQGVLTDITERRVAEEALGRRERILEAAGYAAERFLREPTWSGAIEQVLSRLGRAGEVSRAFVFRNLAGQGERRSVLECGWADPGQHGRAQARGTDLDARMREVERWEDRMLAGEVVHGRPQDDEAIICAPILVDGTWWGTIGFERPRERDWQSAEIDAVRVAANTLGAAISRELVARRLSDTEARFRTLVEQMPAITYLNERRDAETGEQWVNVYISPQVQDILGWSPQEWYEDPGRWGSMIHPEDFARAREADDRHRRTGEPLDIEIRVTNRSGELRWIRDEAIMILDDDGRPLWSQGILSDVTERKTAEQSLHEAEARYRGLIETIPAATYIDSVDAISQAIYMSPQVKQIYGYTPEEWRSQPYLWEEGLHPDDRDDVIARVERHNREGVPYEAEYRFRHRDGRWVWVHDEATMIPLEGGGRVSQGVIYDVTPQKEQEEQLREAEERYRAIVEHVPSVIYLDKVGPPMESLYVSPMIESMMGVTSEEWMRDADLWIELTHPEDREAVAAGYFGAAEAGRPWSAEYRVITRDGRTIWVHDETTYLHDEEGRPKFIQGVISDVTARKVAEQALRESEQREREAAERLRMLDEMKNTFLAAVSHELRSPLTSILGLSLTLERSPEMAQDDREDLLGRLGSNARKLDRLLKDLLDIDRLNRGIVEPQYRTVDLAALTHRTLETLDQLADREIVTEGVEPVMIAADPAKLERILENLVMNAARHTSEDRRIWIRIEPEDGGALIAVEDEGTGVADELKQVIFEPFRQGPIRSPHSPGTGIGLSLVARFAELHGGRAWVEDRPGGGASFRVFIPDRSLVAPTETDEPAGELVDEATRG
jgi:PAS domain S-box-containing protein